MAQFGVGTDGFSIKGFDLILAEALGRARDIFGANVDLSATSPLRKILETTAAEDAELWKRMEDLYYSNFVSTAVADSLDLLGEDVGVVRREGFAQGDVTFTLGSGVPGRDYLVPEGTVVVTAVGQAFYTTRAITLTAATPQQAVSAQAFERGPTGNVVAAAIVDIDPQWRIVYFSNLGPGATLAVTNAQPFSGGDVLETDEVYRARLLGLPRNLWTLEALRRAVLDVDGVLDVALSDPLGGVDVSQSYFNLFNFGDRLFSGQRRLGEPYFFDVIVAHEFVWPWGSAGAVTGIFERVTAAVDRVRPVGVHPNIIEANHIEVGVQAQVIVESGYDADVILATIKQRLARDMGSLKLGADVLYSQIMCAFVEQPGVADVQNLHLRRCPAAYGRITFGGVPFQAAAIEAGVGENLVLGPAEIAVFRQDSPLNDLEVVRR